MSLEEALAENTAAVKALAKAISAGIGNTAATAAPEKAATNKTAATKTAPKGTGKKAPPADEDELDLGGDDELDLDDDGEEAPAFTFDDVKKLMTELRDIDGPAANKAECSAILTKMKVKNFNELKGDDEALNKAADLIKKAIAKH